ALGIVERLGGHALAVEVVGVYLADDAHQKISYREYLTGLEQSGITLVERSSKDGTLQLSLNPQSSIARLLAPTLDLLTLDERAVVEWAALLPPDMVPRRWLEHFLREDYAEFAAAAAAGEEHPSDAVFGRLEK